MRIVPEDYDGEAKARALEALRMRLDPDAAWPAERSWPHIAKALGYPSGDACKRAAWRTFNRVAYGKHADWLSLHQWVTLARSIGLERPDTERIRTALRALDAQAVPEDQDPPKPPKKLTKKALRDAILTYVEERQRTVDADPDPHAVVVHAAETLQSQATSGSNAPRRRKTFDRF